LNAGNAFQPGKSGVRNSRAPGGNVVGLLKISSAIDWVNARFGVIANWLVLLSCLISAGNAVSRYLFSESSNGWLEVQWYMFAGMVLPAGRTPSPATSTSASTSSTARSRSARASGSTSSAVPWGCPPHLARQALLRHV
jgi:hypothetical protein